MHIYFNTHFDKILSLGSNCYPKFFISKILKPSYGETELFDYIGSSMWSINMLILNDFKDIHNDTYFKLKPVLENVKILYINLDTDGWNERQNIFSVKIKSLHYDWANAHKIIATLFEEKQVCNKLMDLAPST